MPLTFIQKELLKEYVLLEQLVGRQGDEDLAEFLGGKRFDMMEDWGQRARRRREIESSLISEGLMKKLVMSENQYLLTLSDEAQDFIEDYKREGFGFEGTNRESKK